MIRKLNDSDLARGPEEVFTIINKIGRGWETSSVLYSKSAISMSFFQVHTVIQLYKHNVFEVFCNLLKTRGFWLIRLDCESVWSYLLMIWTQWRFWTQPSMYVLIIGVWSMVSLTIHFCILNVVAEEVESVVCFHLAESTSKFPNRFPGITISRSIKCQVDNFQSSWTSWSIINRLVRTRNWYLLER